MQRIWSFLLVFGLMSAHVSAQDTYLDDRSTAEGLVRSLYNAINRNDFGRAYEYFSDAPAKNFASYAKGYADTTRVDVLVGRGTSEGAAGSIFTQVPVALRSKNKNGLISYFSGCYTVRQINAEQDPPTKPLQISKAKLKASAEGDFNLYAMPECGSGDSADNSVAPLNDLELVKALFVAENKESCMKSAETLAGINDPQVFELTAKSATSEDFPSWLYVFFCDMAAYNSTEVYYLKMDTDIPQRISFASPNMKIKYKDGDEDSAKLESMKVDGWVASGVLVNSAYDPATKTISAFTKWRGLGDAFSNGTWVYNDGKFVLRDFSLDPTYDDAQTPVVVVKSGLVQSPY